MLKKIIYPLFLLGVGYILFSSHDANIIIAGLAVFVIGMVFMEDGFKLFSGGVLEKVLYSSTDNVPKAIGTGFVATAIVQSSSLISVIVISFLSAELITLSGAIGIIFGSNIGTTTTAWIVSTLGVKVQISHYALPMIIFGVIFRFNKNSTYKALGNILFGLGFIFLGISYMKDGFENMSSELDLSIYAMEGYLGILVYVLVGAVSTILMQSSSATIALIITALAVGQITYINALELAIGTNIGTTVTAVIGALSSNSNGKRLAVAHFIFNFITGVIAIIFLYQLAGLVDLISLKVGISDEDYAMKLALFHTLFNVVGVLSVSPFTSKLVSYLNGLFKEDKKDISRAKYLDSVVIEVPQAAIAAITKEIIHLYDNATEVLSHALSMHRHTFIGASGEIGTIVKSSVVPLDMNIDDFYEKKIKILYGDIINYATISEENMSVEDKNKIYSLKVACRDIVETIKIVKELQKNVNRFIKSKNEHIRAEYNHLREAIAKTLDVIHTLRNASDDLDVLVKIKLLEESLSELDMIGNGRIDTLIRNNYIETKMATSIINDSAFAYDISKKLIHVATILWIEDKQIQELGER